MPYDDEDKIEEKIERTITTTTTTEAIIESTPSNVEFETTFNSGGSSERGHVPGNQNQATKTSDKGFPGGKQFNSYNADPNKKPIAGDDEEPDKDTEDNDEESNDDQEENNDRDGDNSDNRRSRESDLNNQNNQNNLTDQNQNPNKKDNRKNNKNQNNRGNQNPNQNQGPRKSSIDNGMKRTAGSSAGASLGSGLPAAAGTSAKNALTDGAKQVASKGGAAFKKLLTNKWFWIGVGGALLLILIIWLISTLAGSGDMTTLGDCTEGIVVTPTESNPEGGTVPLSDYIKSVIYNSYDYENLNDEQLKATSEVLTTYIITETEVCTSAIDSDHNDLIYKDNVAPEDEKIQIVDSVNSTYISDEEEFKMPYEVTPIKLRINNIANSNEATDIEILKKVYNDDMIFLVNSMFANGDGGPLLMDPESGFAMRLVRPPRTSAFFYAQDATNYGKPIPYEGECASYAHGRANEILASIGSTKTVPGSVDGGSWCNYMSGMGFRTGSSLRQGALISWSYGSFGHVAVVEKIENGQVTISESYIGLGGLIGAGKRFATKDAFRRAQTPALRKENCESNGSGCFKTTLFSSEAALKSSYSGFQCYIYLD